MRVVQAARRALCGAALLGAAAAAGGCELLALEHRGGRELLRLPLAADAPQLELAFTHSVLGTPVADRYRWRGGEWQLVEERFEGQGYGLPHAPAAGERLARDGERWSLHLSRTVMPLVVRPVQRMRLQVGALAVELAALTAAAVELRAEGCP